MVNIKETEEKLGLTGYPLKGPYSEIMALLFDDFRKSTLEEISRCTKPEKAVSAGYDKLLAISEDSLQSTAEAETPPYKAAVAFRDHAYLKEFREMVLQKISNAYKACEKKALKEENIAARHDLPTGSKKPANQGFMPMSLRSNANPSNAAVWPQPRSSRLPPATRMNSGISNKRKHAGETTSERPNKAATTSSGALSSSSNLPRSTSCHAQDMAATTGTQPRPHDTLPAPVAIMTPQASSSTHQSIVSNNNVTSPPTSIPGLGMFKERTSPVTRDNASYHPFPVRMGTRDIKIIISNPHGPMIKVFSLNHGATLLYLFEAAQSALNANDMADCRPQNRSIKDLVASFEKPTHSVTRLRLRLSSDDMIWKTYFVDAVKEIPLSEDCVMVVEVNISTDHDEEL